MAFLAAGYKSEYCYWELLIVMRKVLLLFLNAFLSTYGTGTQALIVLLVLILFLVLTARKRPHLSDPLFDLEALSLFAILLTAYCGLFFLGDAGGTSSLSTTANDALLATILGAHGLFFLTWLWRLVSELEGLKGLLLRNCPSLYLAFYACGDKDQAFMDR